VILSRSSPERQAVTFFVFCRPIIKIPALMLKNSFKSAWRSLGKNKIFSILNITGLSIGLACSLLIALYVVDELGYDSFNTKSGRIYRIDEQVKYGDFHYDGAEVPAIMGPSLARDFNEVEQYVRFKTSPGVVIRKGTENIREDKVIYADSTLFDVFTLPMIAGDKKTALKESRNLVITESAAKRYFGSLDIIGKTLLVNGDANYKITGVIKDIPRQCHFNFDLFMPVCELDNSRNKSWVNYNYQTYLLLKPGTDVRKFEKQLNKAEEQYQSPWLKSDLNLNADDFKAAGNYIRCSLTPLTRIHLYSHIADELGINGNIRYIYILSAISIFILLIACINFMNLSTARSANRAKEVGIRKVLGSLRTGLITQFLIESFVACLLSFIVAIVMAALFLPFFNQLTGKQIAASILLNPLVLFGLLSLLILVSLLSGSYPAFFLSSFQPIKVLKGRLSMGFKGSALRNTLVVLQFTISVVLMIGTLVIYNQLGYIRDRDLGFNKEHVLIVQNSRSLGENSKAFANELLRIPGVKDVTSSRFLPVTGSRTDEGFIAGPHFDGRNFTIMQGWFVDERYIPTFQIQMKSGRNFSNQYPTDSMAVVINETAAKIFGNTDPLNKTLYRIEDIVTRKIRAFKVIGVIKDFNFNSLREQVKPLVLTLYPDNGAIAVRIDTRDIPGLLHRVKGAWASMSASQPFSYAFLDEEFNREYIADQQMGKIFLLFSILAILIACLGLFGLVTFAAEQRIKEIGIRKTLGADVPDILKLLSRDLIRLLLLSILIASPIAWWAMNKWLQDFAFRISIGWWTFAEVGAVCLLIAIVTISFQTIKAAMASPVSSLRSE
jgi:putative ABC transport system permease protein